MSFEPGEIISHMEMSIEEGRHLQQGMNYRIKPHYSVVLMSVRPGAPYSDRVEDEGKTLIYEGHDVRNSKDIPDPKSVDQPLRFPGGSLTQNGLFLEAAISYKKGNQHAEQVKVYEKLRAGIWVYNGLFSLVDVWKEQDGSRSVFKFKLCIVEKTQYALLTEDERSELEHSRAIPSSVMQEVWKRDKGRCVKCGSNENLHFDHIIPFSKGGSSLTSANIQLLCAKHNLAKRDNIE